MSNLRKVAWWIPTIIGLCILIFCASHLSSSKYHNSLIKYGVPICRLDRHQYKGETCEACGSQIKEAGVFFSSKAAMEDPYGNSYQLPFADYYESYEEFKADYNDCLIYSVVAFVCVVFEIAFVIYKLRTRKHKIGGKLK